ncbi:MAG: hypothetical protein HY823_08810 [Acidobacteria bacterium]|nr:hypothetical protein [Acidobacteriota bacterium]
MPPNLPMAAPGYYIVRWEKLLGGRVIQELRSNSRSASEVTRVTYFWDFRNAQVAYLAVTPRTLDRGTIREDQGKIIRTGTLTFANDSVDYVETWEVTPAGKLIQRYVPAKGNGHVLEMEKAASAATR